MSDFVFDNDAFNKSYIQNGSFKHNPTVFKLFPYVTSPSNKDWDSFDYILGAFIRYLKSKKKTKAVEYSDVIDSVLERVTIDKETERAAFRRLIEKAYFDESGRLKCDNIHTYEYSQNSSTENKISEFLVSVLCDNEIIEEYISQCKDRSSNLLDQILNESLPVLNDNDRKSEYFNLNPRIRELFTEDICFLLENGTFNGEEITELLSYYYFFYISQSIFKLDNSLENKSRSEEKLYYCLSWEKTSQTRKCYNYGWKKVERHLDSMFSHAILLDMLNFINFGKQCCYDEMYRIYEDSDSKARADLYRMVFDLKTKYETEYIKEKNIPFEAVPQNGDFSVLLKAFHKSIKTQFLYSDNRKAASERFGKKFFVFSKNNFLQNRGKNGLMLALDEERIVLLTKVVLKNREQIKFNDLLSEFEIRGIFFDKSSKEALIEFYDKLGLIEKKSDSGDAKYVKGIL